MRTRIIIPVGLFILAAIPSATAMLSIVPVDTVTPNGAYTYESNSGHGPNKLDEGGAMVITNAVTNVLPYSFTLGIGSTQALDAVQIYNGKLSAFDPGADLGFTAATLTFKNLGTEVVSYNVVASGARERLVYTFPQINADEMVLEFTALSSAPGDPEDGWLKVREVFFNGTDDLNTFANPDGNADPGESAVQTAVPEPSAALLSFVFLALGFSPSAIVDN